MRGLVNLKGFSRVSIPYIKRTRVAAPTFQIVPTTLRIHPVNQVRKRMNTNTNANQCMYAVQVLGGCTVTYLREQCNRRYQSKTCCAIAVLCRLSLVGIRPTEGMHCSLRQVVRAGYSVQEVEHYVRSQPTASLMLLPKSPRTYLAGYYP